MHAERSFIVQSSSQQALVIYKQAEAFGKAKKWEKAIEKYNILLKKYPRKLLKIKDSYYLNVSYVVLSKLEKLPPKAKKLYQSMFAIHAEHSLRKKKNKIQTIVKFINTKEGKKALTHLISNLISKEQYEKALLYIKLYSRFTKENEEAMIARKAFCFYGLGEQRALEYLKRYCEENKHLQPIHLGNKKQKLEIYIESLIKKCQNRYKLLNIESSWKTYGNTYFRNFYTNFSIKNIAQGWSKKTPIVPIRGTKRYYYNDNNIRRPGPIQSYPIIANSTVYVSNGKEIYAYHLYSGKQKWKFAGLISQKKSIFQEQTIHSMTYHKGYIYANVEGATPNQKEVSWRIYNIQKILPERRLIKLDANTGRFIWKVEDEKGTDEDEIDHFAKKVSFMSAPIYLGNSLFVGATEKTGLFNSYVLKINPKNGRITQKTIIGSGQQEQNMFGRAVKATTGSHITSGNALLYYLTNIGSYCCISPITGEIRWLRLYNRINIIRPRGALFQTIYRKNGWYNSPIILSGNRVFLAPIDSNYLFCVNANTGKLLWKRARNQSKYLLGASADYLFIGGKSLEMYNIKTGNQEKAFRLERGEEVKGYGMISEKYFYCPCSLNIYCINIKKKEIEKKIKWPTAKINAGHILSASPVIISSSRTHINAFYDWDQLLEILTQNIKKDPKNPLTYLKIADFYTRKSKSIKHIEKSIAMYKKAYQWSNVPIKHEYKYYFIRAKRGLIESYKRLAQQYENKGLLKKSQLYYEKVLTLTNKAETAVPILLKKYKYNYYRKNHVQVKWCLDQLIKRYGKHKQYIPTLDQKITIELHAFFLLAKYYIQNLNPKKAIETYHIILDRHRNTMYGDDNAGNITIEAITKIIHEYGIDIYKQYDIFVWKTYQKTKMRKYNSTDLLRIVNRTPNSKHTPKIYLEMIELMIKENQTRKAMEHLKKFLRFYKNSNESKRAYVLLLESYEKLKLFSLAMELLKDLQKNKKGVIVFKNQKVAITTLVSQRLKRPEYLKIAAKELPKLQLWEKHNPICFNEKVGGYLSLRLLKPQGDIPLAYKTQILFNSGRTLYCRNAKNGKLLWTQSNIGWIYSLGFLENSLICWTSRKIFSVNPKTGSINWKEQLPNKFISLTLKNNFIGILSRYTRDIAQIHLMTKGGKVKWKTTFPGKIPGDLLIGQDTIIGYARTPSTLRVYQISTGKLLKQYTNKKRRALWMSFPILTSNKYLCVVKEKKWIECYELPSLNLKWRYDASSIYIPSYTSNSVINGNERYICFIRTKQLMRHITCIYLATGEVKWDITVPHESINAIIPDKNQIYFLKRRRITGTSLAARSIKNGSIKWITSLKKGGNTDIFRTKKHLVILNNTYANGYKTQIDILSKKQGKKLRTYYHKEGDRGRYFVKITLAGEKIWFTQDRRIYALGKK